MNVSDVPYLSPVMHFDAEARLMVVQRRDAKTGEVSSQTPSQEEVKRSRVARLTEMTPEDASTSGLSTRQTAPQSEPPDASHGRTAEAAIAAPDTGSARSTSPLRISVLV